MPTIRLTDKALSRKAPAQGQLELWDELLPGFGLRISYGGKRTYFIMTRVAGRQIRRTVGTPEALTLADAREKARDLLRSAARGIDPAEAEAKAKREAERARRNTFRAVAEDFMADRGAKLRSRDDMQARLDRDILPAWGGRPIRDIGRADVRQLLRDKAKLHPIAANRCLALVRVIFNWALDEELIDASPAARIKPPSEEQERDRVLNDAELVRLWRGFDALGAPFGPLFKIMLLTGQRKRECSGMRWSEIDGNVWSVPGERAKGGAGHAVPLASWTLEIINGTPRVDGAAHVFTTGRRRGKDSEQSDGKPGDVDRAVSGWGKVKLRLDRLVAEAAAKEAGEPLDMDKHALPGWRLHDLRRSFATGLRTLGVDRLTVSKCLNHAEAGVTKVYDRYSADPEKRAAMERWAQHIGGLVTGRSAKVENIAGRRRRAK